MTTYLLILNILFCFLGLIVIEQALKWKAAEKRTRANLIKIEKLYLMIKNMKDKEIWKNELEKEMKARELAQKCEQTAEE